MALDLSMLDDAPLGAVPANQVDAVLALRLDEVEEDPDQPRRIFDPVELEGLADSIRQRGVQAPILVRPSVAGIYRIIHGSRRYRASKLAGKTTIPAIVKTNVRLFDDYSQIVENLQRADLGPIEIAHFIRKRQVAGDSNKVIAQQLGMIAASVTWHLALLNCAEPILAAFHAGRLTGAEQVYHLQRLHEQQPQTVETFLAASPDITQRMIRDLGAAIGGKAATKDEPMNPSSATGIPAGAVDTRSNGANSSGANLKGSGAPSNPDDVNVRPVAGHLRDATPRQSDPTRLKRPALRASYDGEVVTLQLFRCPTSPGFAFVKSERGGGETEVELSRLSNLILTEGA